MPHVLRHGQATRVRRSKTCAAAACLALALLLAAAPGAAAQAPTPETPSGSPASVDDTSSSSSNAANTSSSDDQLSTGAWLLQRLQRAMEPPRPNQGADDNSTDSTTADDDMSDFASTANALTQQAVREGNVRAAALAQRTAAEDEPQNSIASDGSSSSVGTSGTSSNVAMLQLLELQQQTANSTVPDADSTDGSDEGLQLLLQTVRQQWNTARNRQRQQQQPAAQPPANAGEQWVSGLKAMADKYPSLTGFARLASNNSALVRELSQTSQLPSIVLAPTNTVLQDYLIALRTLAAEQAAGPAAGAGSVSGGSSTQDTAKASMSSVPLEQLIDNINKNSTVDSLLLLRRHFVPARQPHLLDSSGQINRQLLERGSNPLVFTSLVLKTSLGTYIQVSQLPQGPGAQRLADVVNPARIAATARNASKGNSTPPGSTSLNSTPSNNAGNSSYGPLLLHVGHSGSALARPFVLRPTSVLVVPIDTVLTDEDEVVNRLTAARLRGAFGWSPEDEHALLSAVYLDPDASYWVKSQAQFDSRGGRVDPTIGMIQHDISSGPSVQGQARPTTNSKDSSSGASSSGSSGSTDSGKAAGGDSSSSTSDSKSDNSKDKSGGGKRRLRRLQQDMEQQAAAPAAENSAGSSSSNNSGNSDNSSAGNGASSPSSNPPAAESSGIGLGVAAVGPGSGAVPAFVAESRARQQQLLVQMQMSDALAANLMTTEAISAWVSAAVLNPAAVFDLDSLKRLPKAGAVTVDSSTKSSGGSGFAFPADAQSSSGQQARRVLGALQSSSSAGSAPQPDDLAFMPLVQSAKLLSEGTVTPQRLLSAFRDRMQLYDSTLNTAVTVTSGLADSQAAAAQQVLATQHESGSNSSGIGGSVHSLLTGIPYGLKDLFSVPGYPTTWGLSALRNRTIDTPSWAYSTLSGLAGGVLLAKTATGELAWGDTWFDNITTRNPWNVDTGSCGSSAGSAAAVAAGLLPFAIGSETWGSVVCPATTVGISAYRPSGGTVPNNGLLQVSPTLDKTGIFCRQLLDCAVVADALMDTQASMPNKSSSTTASGCCSSPYGTSTPRLHRQDPAQAAAFNYTAHQQQLAGKSSGQSQPMPAQATAAGNSVFPATFQELPALSQLCIGYLHGTSTRLLSVLRSLNPACIKGPLSAPGNPSMVRDVLPTVMQAEVAISYEGLWLEGLIGPDNHWWPSIQLGQLAPAATYLRAQQLRGLLLQETRQYFDGHGIHVLVKPARSTVGLDGLAALLDMPEVLLPVEIGEATFADAEPVVTSADGVAVGDSGSMDASSGQRNQNGSNGSSSGSSSDTGGGDVIRIRWTQPKVNSILALPGGDAFAIAVGAAFQSVTDVHLQRPPLPTPDSGASKEQSRVVSG